MRQMRPIIVGLLGCVLSFATVSHLSAQTTDGLAKVVAIHGNAQYFMPGQSTPQPLREGMVIKSGMTIQTASGMGNYVDLVLYNSHAAEAPSASPSEIAHYTPKAEQDGIRIKENSVLLVDKLTITQTGADIVTDTELDLKSGTILGTVKKLSPQSKYEVKIPNGVAGIRGTIYEISASGIIKVLSGVVLVAYVGPDNNIITQTVNAGQEYDTSTGLVTTISAQDIHDLILNSIPFRFFNDSPRTYVAPDHRIYFISPTQNGQGQNQGGNGGGNGQGSLSQGITIIGPSGN